jgi:hypothetical protein
MAEEKPTLEIPVEETPEAGGTDSNELESLIKTLEEAGVKTTKELEGKLTASREAGQLANLLGDANKRIADLERASKIPSAEPSYSYDEGQPIDIEAAISKGINKVLDERDAKTRQVQQQGMKIWQRIQGDKDYKLVKDVWEAKNKDPNFLMEIQAGTKNYADEYMETVREFYKGVARQSLDTIKKLQGGIAPAAPHVEGEATMPGMPEQPTGNETIIKAKEKVEKGGRLSVEEEMAALDDILRS